MITYKRYLNKTIGKVLTNEIELNNKIFEENTILRFENSQLIEELAILKDSKLYKLWPIYSYIKNIFIK